MNQGTEFGQELREWDEEIKQKKRESLERNSGLIEAAAQNLGFSIEVKTTYHFRLTKDGYTTVDVWPQSSKTHFLGFKNAVKYRHDLSEFLDKHFS